MIEPLNNSPPFHTASGRGPTAQAWGSRRVGPSTTVGIPVGVPLHCECVPSPQKQPTHTLLAQRVPPGAQTDSETSRQGR